MIDKRARCVEKRNSKLTHRYLNEDVFPIIFPNCPQYLPKKKPVPQTSNTTSSGRQAIVIQRQEDKEMQLYSIKSLEDIENKLITNDIGTVHHDYNFMVGSDKIIIYSISIDGKGLPNVKYAIDIHGHEL